MKRLSQTSAVAPKAEAIRELPPGELETVHGGALNITMPEYIPMSVSHPKVEVTLPRVPYK